MVGTTPVVEAPVHLHQRPELLPSLASLPVPAAPTPPLPLPFRQQPASQRLVVDDVPLLCQLLRRQGRPKAVVDLVVALQDGLSHAWVGLTLGSAPPAPGAPDPHHLLADSAGMT